MQRGETDRQYTGIPGIPGKVLDLSARSPSKFCADCNRIRMTAEGFVKPCLQFAKGVDMRALLRGQNEEYRIKRGAETVDL